MKFLDSKNADKIKSLTEKAKRILVDIRIEKLSRLSRKAIIGAGAAALGLVVVSGALILLPPSAEPDQQADASVLKTAADKVVTYCAIEINGKKVAALPGREEAQSVLDQVASHYQTEGSELVSVTYAEQVVLTEVSDSNPQFVPVEEAVAMILTGTKQPKTYTIASGDNFWDISVDNGMTVDQLIASNPSVDPDRLQIGTTLNLFETKPYLHLTLTEKITATENIDYPVEYEETGALYKGETRVKVAGVYGQRQVQKQVVRENGMEVSSTELDSKVLSEPKTQVVLKGTKSLSTLVGSGNFTSPMGFLEISSAYGSRGGGRHTGVDLRNPEGTPIYVVDDGVVQYAGTRGSYGNLVIVSHGNGIETWYAHCDTLQVKIGDVVSKGDQIATVGITGRATGYHLHFEVRKNGIPQNPMNYL